ncbi:MAG: T9SS type A sorting domain-containing protein [Flavobacteriales bacterium]|nr:T9SS type A sorting domain-containing protein [Flavobacteriales bacterium]
MKTTLSILLIISLSILTNAQTTAIPDANFEQALIDLGYDVVHDGQVLTLTISSINDLQIPNYNITDLTGITDFSSLEILGCANNQLTTINLTQNPTLIGLHCENNLLTTLDLSQNENLYELECQNNLLTSLDLSQNINLEFIVCSNNQLTSLNTSNNAILKRLICSQNSLAVINVSQNNLLTELFCMSNQLTCLNVKNGNNLNFTTFNTVQNSNLTCIEVDNTIYSSSTWGNIPASASFSTNCNPCSVGIEENNLSNLSVYPNPTTGSINIDLEETNSNINLLITNTVGQVVLTQNYKSTHHINFDLDAPKGIYFLKLEIADGETKTLKVLKE